MTNALLKKPEWRMIVLYVLVVSFLFCLVGALALVDSSKTPAVYFLTQVYFLGLGLLHVRFGARFLPWLDRDAFLPGALTTLLLLVIGAVTTVGFLRWTDHGESSIFYSTGSLLFALPFFVRKTFDYFLRLPAKEFKRWYYPVNRDLPDLDTLDLTRVLVIQFEFSKKDGDPVRTNFKAKAPVAMRLGELFFIFINDYSERHSESAIQYLDAQQKPFGWLFRRKTAWWQRQKYLDPDLTFQENHIGDNDTIVTVRA